MVSQRLGGMTVAIPLMTIAVLVGADSLQPDDVLFGKKLADRAGGGDGVAEADGLGELEILPQIDGAGAGKAHAQHRRDRGRRRGCRGRSDRRRGLAGRHLVGMGGVKISGDAGKEIDVGLPDGLHRAGRSPIFIFLNGHVYTPSCLACAEAVGWGRAQKTAELRSR